MKDVAVLLATYNGAKYIREQLDSLFEQSCQDFRLIIHDDGSTDETVSILEEYLNKYKDRIEIIYGHPTGSPKANFMYLLSQVEADYYFFCDQDDVWYPDKIKKSLDILIDTEMSAKHMSKEPVAVFSDMTVVDNELNIIDNSFIRYLGRSPKNIQYTQILIDNPAAGTTMCFNRTLRDIAISCDSVRWENVPMHDAWVLELGAIFGTVKAIDEPMVYYRQTGDNIMGAVTESTSEKVSRNAKDVSNGLLEKKKAFINEARIFAREILRLKDIPEDKLKVLNGFVHIGSKPKLYRINYYRKHNFTRAKHNLWMQLWV